MSSISLFGLVIGWILASIPLNDWKSAAVLGLWGLSLWAAVRLFGVPLPSLLLCLGLGALARFSFDQILRERYS